MLAAIAARLAHGERGMKKANTPLPRNATAGRFGIHSKTSSVEANTDAEYKHGYPF